MKPLSFICAAPRGVPAERVRRYVEVGCSAHRAEYRPCSCVFYLSEEAEESASLVAGTLGLRPQMSDYSPLFDVSATRELVYQATDCAGVLAKMLGCTPEQAKSCLVVAPQGDIVTIGRTLFEIGNRPSGEVKDDAVAPVDFLCAELCLVGADITTPPRIKLRRFRPNEVRWQRLATVELPRRHERPALLARASG